MNASSKDQVARPVQVRRMDARAPGFDAELKALLAWEASQDAAIETAVTAILEQVRARGDAALIEYTQRFDRLAVSEASALELPQSALTDALGRLPVAEREALQQAADRVRAYHERQRSGSWDYTDALGNRLGQKVTPLDRVGLYVPGGKAAYPSSVLMNALPAKVAGVGELIMVCPTPDGVRNPMVLAAAASTMGLRTPSGVGQTMMSSPTPATLAGMAFMSTEEG